MDRESVEQIVTVDQSLTKISKMPIILLCIIGMILAPLSVYDDDWLNSNIDTDDFWGTIMQQNVYISLDTFQMEICADDDCEIEEKEKLGDLYQICYDEVIEEEGENEVDNEEMAEICGPWNELHKAGKTTKTLIFGSMILIFVGILASLSPISNEYRLTPYSIITAGGGLVLVSIYNWNLMLPEFTENLDRGTGQAIAIFSGIIFIIAGVIGMIQSRMAIKQELPINSADASEE